MLIRVRYVDGRFDFVKPVLLDRLLDDKKIDSFQRKNGWALVGVDPIRGMSANKSFQRSERRASIS